MKTFFFPTFFMKFSMITVIYVVSVEKILWNSKIRVTCKSCINLAKQEDRLDIEQILLNSIKD